MKINGSIWAGRALLAAFLLSFLMGSAQQPVSLDSCRQMALKNNKQLRIAEEKVKGAGYTKKSARGAYFPGIDFTGAYMYKVDIAFGVRPIFAYKDIRFSQSRIQV